MSRLIGPTLTVKARPGDNMMAMKAIEEAQPGDIVLGDKDGVVIVPHDAATRVVEVVPTRQAREQMWLEHIERGDFSPLIDTDETLLSQGCEICQA